MKPWGPLLWLLGKLPPRQRDVYVLGSLAAEERCQATPLLGLARGATSIRLLDIKDPPSRYSDRIETKKQAYRALLREKGLQADSIQELPLLVSAQWIADCLDGFLPSPTFATPIELWLDMSCLPKRFFFLLIKLALGHRAIETLIVTYTQPAPGRYTDEHLAEDPEDVSPLPGFGPLKEDPNAVIVSLGFEPLGLPQFLGEYRDRRRRIVFLLPFPPGQPYSRRVWQSIFAVGGEAEGPNVRRLPAIDAFNTYGELCRLFDPGLEQINGAPPALAPYGPKPMSLGMCLYAIQTGSPVFYTQPRRYHPDYTLGIGSSWGYCLKLGNREVWR